MPVRTRAERASLKEHVWELRLRGLEVREIGISLNIPEGTLWRWLKEMTEEAALRAADLADGHLQMELARLDRYLAILEERIEEVENPEAIVNTALKLGERRAKLLGLDSAQKIDARVTETTQMDLEITALVEAAKAAAALEEQRIREGAE